MPSSRLMGSMSHGHYGHKMGEATTTYYWHELHNTWVAVHLFTKYLCDFCWVTLKAELPVYESSIFVHLDISQNNPARSVQIKHNREGFIIDQTCPRSGPGASHGPNSTWTCLNLFQLLLKPVLVRYRLYCMGPCKFSSNQMWPFFQDVWTPLTSFACSCSRPHQKQIKTCLDLFVRFLWVFLVVSHLSNLSVPLLRSCQDKKLLMERCPRWHTERCLFLCEHMYKDNDYPAFS